MIEPIRNNGYLYDRQQPIKKADLERPLFVRDIGAPLKELFDTDPFYTQPHVIAINHAGLQEVSLAPTNPFFDVFAVEGEYYDPEQIAQAQRVVLGIIKEAVCNLQKDVDRSPGAILKTIYNTIYKDLKYSDTACTLLSEAVLAKNIDCDTGSMIFMFIAHELALPLTMVNAPGHTFIRWSNADNTVIDFETTDGFVLDHTLEPSRQEIVAAEDMKVNSYNLLSQQYFDDGQIEQAIVAAEKAKMLKPNAMSDRCLAFYHSKLGDKSFELYDLNGALREYEKVFKLSPDDQEYKLNFYFQRGNIEQTIEAALPWYDKAVGLDADKKYLKFYNLMLLSFALTKQLRAEGKDFSALLESTKEYKTMYMESLMTLTHDYNDKGLALLRQGEFSKAIEVFKKTKSLFNLFPKDYQPVMIEREDTLYRLAGVYEYLKMFDKAVPLYEVYTNPYEARWGPFDSIPLSYCG